MNRMRYWEDGGCVSTWKRRLDGSRTWYVSSGAIDHSRSSFEITAAEIIIPLSALGGLTEEEIGQNVKSLVRDAYAIHAVALADDILAHRKELFRDYRGNWNYAADARDIIAEFQDYPDIDKGGAIKKALRLISDLEAHVDRKEKGKTTKRYERAAAARDFDTLFVAVGRRDGFKCAACGSVEDLQLDHIEPVTLGGTTHPNNLQLLCKPCNLHKGERTVDYRSAQQSDEIQ